MKTLVAFVKGRGDLGTHPRGGITYPWKHGYVGEV